MCAASLKAAPIVAICSSGVQERYRIEKRMVRFADGSLSDQIEQAAAVETRSVRLRFLDLNRCYVFRRRVRFRNRLGKLMGFLCSFVFLSHRSNCRALDSSGNSTAPCYSPCGSCIGTATRQTGRHKKASGFSGAESACGKRVVTPP